MVTKNYMSIYELCEYTTLSKTTIYRLIKESEFPAPRALKQLEKRVFWVLDEVDSWFMKNMVQVEDLGDESKKKIPNKNVNLN